MTRKEKTQSILGLICILSFVCVPFFYIGGYGIIPAAIVFAGLAAKRE